jgi:hypothetical protein
VSTGSESVVLEMELADSRPVTFAFEFAAQQSVRLLEVRVQPAAAGVAPPEAVDEEENL